MARTSSMKHGNSSWARFSRNCFLTSILGHMSYLDEAIAISSMKARAGRRRYSLVMPYALPLCLWVSQSPRCSRRRHLQERHSLFTMGYLHKHCPTLDSSPLQFFTLNILHFYGPQYYLWTFTSPTVSRLLLPWSVLRGGGSPTYSGYMVEKTHMPRTGFKFIRTKFRTNFGCMDFYKPITTVRG